MRDFENNPYGEDEQFPTFRISIRTAARLIGEGLNEWNGEEIPDSDHAPFLKLNPTSESVYFRAHEYANTEPIGKMKTACEGIEAAIVNAVNQGHIVPRQTRRSIAGAVKPEKTYLNVDDVISWCETVGIDSGESIFEYRELEEKIAGSAYLYLENERFKLENETTLKDVGQSTGRLSEEEITIVLVENLRFRQGHFEPHHQIQDRGLQQRERNTLLSIIAVLCKESKFDYKTHAKTAGLIQSTGATMGISIGETTIEGHLKKIPNALASRMK